jgi:hypothetical protein
VSEGDLTRDGQAEAGRPGAAFAADVQADEPVEDAAPVGGGDAGAIVVDLDLRDVSARGRGDDDAAGRVAQGVVDEVAEEPLEVAGVADSRELRLDAQFDLRPVGRQARHGVGEDGGEVDGFLPSGKLALVGSGEQQELLDELFQAGRLLHGALGDDRPRGPVGVGQADFEGRADGGEWRPQLVGGVGHEPALPAGGIVEPAEHVVHGVGQVPDLVGRTGFGHAPAEVGRGDLGDGPPEVFDGAQRPADDEPYGEAGQDQRDGDGEQQADGELGVQLSQQPGRGLRDDADRPAVDGRPRRDDLGLRGNDAVRGLLAHRLRRAGGQQVDGRLAGQRARGRENMSAGVEDLRFGAGVQRGRGQRRGPGSVVAGLLELGDVGPQLAVHRAPRGLLLQHEEQEEAEYHRGRDRDARHDGHPGAQRAQS